MPTHSIFEQKLLPLTVVGSYPLPSWFRQVLLDAAEGRVTPAQAREAGRDAMLVVIDEQRRAGIDLPTDGEVGRMLGAPDPIIALEETVGFLWGVLTRLEGVHYSRSVTGARFHATGAIGAPNGLGIVQEFIMARELTTAPLKVTMPGPFSVALMLVDPGESAALHEILNALHPILRAELEALARAGAEHVQIDEPSLGMFMGVNPEQWVSAFNELVSGLPLRVHLHVCFRNLLTATRAVPRTYRPLIPYFNDLQVNEIHLEYSLNNMQELESLGEIGFDKRLAIGVVDSQDSQVESASTVASRIRSVLRHVDLTRLSLAPDCGLSALPREVALAKLNTLAEGAALVRAELSRGRR